MQVEMNTGFNGNKQTTTKSFMKPNVSPKYADQSKKISFGEGLTLKNIKPGVGSSASPKNIAAAAGSPTGSGRVTKTKMTKK